MHDIDSTRLEASPNYNELSDSQEFNSYEAQDEQGEESFEMPMSEEEEEALAAELLGVSNEYDMEEFLGGLFRKIKKRIGGAAKFLGPNAGPLAGALKGIAAKALPFLGGALGTAIPIPGLGTVVGAAVGNAASKLLQSELDHLEVEEQDFEMSRRYVRFATQAIRQAGRIPARGNPSAAADAALRNSFSQMRRNGGFRRRPRYMRYRASAPCPPPEPCPTCPACSQALPESDSGQATAVTPQSPGAAAAPVSAESDFEGEFQENGELDETGEFLESGEGERMDEFGNAFEGEGEGEDESYETDNETSSAAAPHSGRWVRRGRKIVLYGL